jgi:hypothetical protein
VTRCHICARPCVREVEPPFGDLPAGTEPDVWTVAMGNGMYVDACQSCWQKWPWEHRLYPETGFGRGPEPLPPFVSLVDLTGGPS